VDLVFVTKDSDETATKTKTDTRIAIVAFNSPANLVSQVHVSSTRAFSGLHSGSDKCPLLWSTPRRVVPPGVTGSRHLWAPERVARAGSGRDVARAGYLMLGGSVGV